MTDENRQLPMDRLTLSYVEQFRPRGVDEQYLALQQDILYQGTDKADRTGVGSRSVFGRSMRFDLRGGRLTLMTSKEVFVDGVIHELLWMLSGSTSIRYLKENNVGIWDSWVKKGTEVYKDLAPWERVARLKKAQREKYNAEFARIHSESISSTPVEGWQEIFYDGMRVWEKPGYMEKVSGVLDELGVPRRVLVDGELPEIYQAQWRAWDDTRLIPLPELSGTMDLSVDAALAASETLRGYQARGFEVVGVLPASGSAREPQAVVCRKVDQIANVIEQLRTNPDSRRIVVSAWNAAKIEDMALPPCHALFQFFTRKLSINERLNVMARSGYMDANELAKTAEENPEAVLVALSMRGIPERSLSCQLYQRSADVPLGVPFNIVQYSLLTQMIAHVTGMWAEEFIWVGGDTHIYANQHEGVQEQQSRDTIYGPKAMVLLNPSIVSIDDFTYDDIKIIGYRSHPPIKFPPAAV